MWNSHNNSDKISREEFNPCPEPAPPVLLQEQPEHSISPESNVSNHPEDHHHDKLNSPHLLSPSAPTLSVHNQELSDSTINKSSTENIGNPLVFMSGSPNLIKHEYVNQDSLRNQSNDHKLAGTAVNVSHGDNRLPTNQDLRGSVPSLSVETNPKQSQAYSSSAYVPLHILDESSMEQQQSASAPVSQHITPRQSTPVRSYGSGGLPRESPQRTANIWPPNHNIESPNHMMSRNQSMKQEPMDSSLLTNDLHLSSLNHNPNHPYGITQGTSRLNNSQGESTLRQNQQAWHGGNNILQSLNAQNSPLLHSASNESNIRHSIHSAQQRSNDFSPGPSTQYHLRMPPNRGMVSGQPGFVPAPLGSQPTDPAANYQKAQIYKNYNQQAVMAAAFAQQQQQQQQQPHGTGNWPVSNNKPSPTQQQVLMNHRRELGQSPSRPTAQPPQTNRPAAGSVLNEGSPTDLLRQLIEVAAEHDIKVQQQVSLYVERDVSPLVDALVTSRSQNSLAPDASPVTMEMENLFRSLCTFLEQSLFYMVEWVRKTNLFRKVPVEDQMQLLHSGWSEVLLMEYLHHYLLYFKDRTLMHHMDGVESSVDLLELLNQYDSKVRLLDLLDRFEQLDLDANEFTCLKFMLLFNPGKHDLNIRSSLSYVEDVQGILFNYLNDYIYRKYPDRPERFGQMILRLPEVKYLSFQLETYLLAKYYSGGIPHQTLLTEMLLTKRMMCESSQSQERGGAGREPGSFSSADNSSSDIRSMS